MKAKSKTTWKNLRAEDKPITLDTTLSLPEDDSGAWRHYRLSSRVICAHISSKCAIRWQLSGRRCLRLTEALDVRGDVSAVALRLLL